MRPDAYAPDGEQLQDEQTSYLRRLGERVRDLRVRRGMTRKILAHDSSMSERYLAQLEAGEGNISIIRLRKLAQAMDIPMEELIRVGADLPSEMTLLVQ